MAELTKEEQLYEMVQEGKRLLLLWQRTSTLNKVQMRLLRRHTKEYLRKSSTNLIMDIMKVGE